MSQNTAQPAVEFTGGEWKVSADDYSPQVSTDEGIICELHTSPFELEVRQANARLIAAAPDLLKALKRFINPTGHTDACWELKKYGARDCTKACLQAKDAIEKATGTAIKSKY